MVDFVQFMMPGRRRRSSIPDSTWFEAREVLSWLLLRDFLRMMAPPTEKSRSTDAEEVGGIRAPQYTRTKIERPTSKAGGFYE
jgi:hypothetical protein